MQHSSKTRTWANDDNTAKASEDPVPSTNQPDDDGVAEELQSLPKKAKIQVPAAHPEPIVVDQSGADENKDEAEQEDSAPGDAEPVSDADWLRSKTSRLLGLLDEDEQAEFNQPKVEERADSPASNHEESRTAAIETIGAQPATNDNYDDDNDDDDVARATPEKDQNVDLIHDSARLFVRNLAYDLTEVDLQPLFTPFGKIEEVSVLFFFHCFPIGHAGIYI